jgi:CRP-like cAMP-binding protein
MSLRLIRKLENYVRLSDAEKRALLQAEVIVKDVDPRFDIARQGQPVVGATLLLEGFGCRYKLLPDGRRQILAYLVPGDMCDPRVFLLDKMDHSIGTISRAKIAIWPRKSLMGVTALYPRITRAFWWGALVNEAIAREWLVSLGQRRAIERLSHLLCELYFRLRAVDLVHANGFDFPVTQTELGDTIGLSAVHVNRTLQDMRREGLVRLANRRVSVLDIKALCNVAMFNPDYLHLNEVGQWARPSVAPEVPHVIPLEPNQAPAFRPDEGIIVQRRPQRQSRAGPGSALLDRRSEFWVDKVGKALVD